MKIDNKVWILLETEKLYGGDYNFVRNKISNLLGVKNKEIDLALSNLAKQRKIKIENNKIEKCEIVVQQVSENEEVVQSLENQLATIVEQNGIVAVKLRGNSGKLYTVAQTEEFKNDIGKTCLIKLETNEDGKVCAKIEDVFGFADDPISENVAIASKYGFSNQFSDKVHAEALKISQDVTEKQREGRTNLEHLAFLTIDPAGCKDKDDAIFDEPTKEGFKTYIAIADVSSGVLPNTELDKEAFKRGNSAYLGGGVYPMLPPELSNGVYSLDEGKSKLALVASATITFDGKILNPKVEYAVINVKKSYSYPEAEKTHNAEDGFEQINQKTKKTLDYIYKNTKVLENMFSKMLEFDSHEPSYKFGDNGKTVEQIFLSNEEYSHKVIETRMILANEIVAQFFKEKGLVGLYRTHQSIRPEKLDGLRKTLVAFGIDFDVENSTESIKQLLEIIKQNPARDYLMAETIKTLSKAGYNATKDEVQHFGLGVKNSDSGYMHFTSPIRRYSDLITHRMLKEIIAGKIPSYSQQTLSAVAEHLNNQSNKADLAERESDKYLACLWAQQHKGEALVGYISQIGKGYIKVMTSNGTVAVTIPTSHLVDATTENYSIIRNGMMLKGKHKSYCVGENIGFKILDIDLESRTIFGDASDEKILTQNTLENELK